MAPQPKNEIIKLVVIKHKCFEPTQLKGTAMKSKRLSTSTSYDDIIELPRHESSHRSKMSMRDRAAQFAPFSAVVGHETAVKEAARHTVQRKEIDEMQKSSVDDQLREIESQLPDAFNVEIVYFQPDAFKTGGQYVTKIGKVKKIILHEKVLLMTDDTKIPIEEIYSLQVRNDLL